MRYAILAAPTIGRVIGTLQGAQSACVNLSDREADRHAFPGERVVRLPRRVSRELARNRFSFYDETLLGRLLTGEG